MVIVLELEEVLELMLCQSCRYAEPLLAPRLRLAHLPAWDLPHPARLTSC